MIRIPPYHYIHVLDQTTNVTRLEVGPATFVRKDNEMVVSGEKSTFIECGMIDIELFVCRSPEDDHCPAPPLLSGC